ncbi:MAG TPA: BLUF domain-containing protein, partial [Turneriella sp.]|nr:BLUF domain-containing protein [Turneriella sp.]
MKRLTYISTFSNPLSPEEIETIAERSIANNTRDNLSGVLFCFNNIFYQILEGPEDTLNRCYARILRDPRHKNIFCLEVESNIEKREFGDWAMKTVRLDESADSLIRPIRTMLNSMARTHYVLERYSPHEILRGLQTGENPLYWKIKTSDKVILFSDIFSSSTFAEALGGDQFEDLLQTYYGITNRSIEESGGTISKLTGDGFMAYFDGSQVEKALDASLEICRRLDDVRKSAPEGSPLRYLYSGIGLSAGLVREGNIGSKIKYDYTLLGDSVNTAARLESVTRKTDYLLVFDEKILAKIPKPSSLRPLGRYIPKGKTERINIYSIDYPYTKRNISTDAIKKSILQLHNPQDNSPQLQ